MNNIEVFLADTGLKVFAFFIIAQLCMVAAAFVIGYIVGRQKYWKEIGFEETEIAEASGQHASGPDGIEDRAGMGEEPNGLSGGHVARDPEPYRAGQA
jgi:hypothetical protein